MSSGAVAKSLPGVHLFGIRLLQPSTQLRWTEAWINKYFRLQFILALIYLFAMAAFFRYFFFDFVEARDGKDLYDPILIFIAPKEVSWLLFGCLYSGIVISIRYLVAYPRRLLMT